MNIKLLTIVIIAFCVCNGAAQNLSANEIINNSIKYHDPSGQWDSFQQTLVFKSERPNGPDRDNIVEIDNTRGYFKNTEEGNDMGVLLDSCFQVPADKTCDNAKRMRNYYLYLWGLPMKLKDSGTQIDERYWEEELEGNNYYVVRVPYDQDIWFFYIDKQTFAMRAYKFYKDEPAKKGEIIYLDEEVVINEMRIPKRRKWVTTPDGRLLGTDILVSAKSLD